MSKQTIPIIVVVAAYAAVATLVAMAPTTITTLSVYAQEQGKACPEGFELKRGVCQAEPRIVSTPPPADCEEGFKLVDDMCRTIEPTRFHMAFCPSGYQVTYYTHPDYGFLLLIDRKKEEGG